MTAQRWWVRAFARWKAKISAVQPDINLFFSTVRTVAIASGIMAYFAVPWWAILGLMGAMLALVIAYTHLYSEGGVWNQTQRDKQDLSSNFSRPIMRIDDEMIARTILAGERERPLTDEERQAIKVEADATFEEYRDGLDLAKYGGSDRA